MDWPPAPEDGHALVYDAASDEIALAEAAGVPGPPGPPGQPLGQPLFHIDTQAVEVAWGRNGFATLAKWDPGSTSGLRYRDLVYDNAVGHWIEWRAVFTAADWAAYVYVVSGPNTGMFRLSVDGVDVGDPVDTYNAVADSDGVFATDLGGLTAGIHVLRCTIVGPRNPASSGDFIVLRHVICSL